MAGHQGTEYHFVFVTAAVKRAGNGQVRKVYVTGLNVHHKASTRETWDSAYATDGTGEKAWL